MRRFLVPRSNWGATIELPKEEARHASKVLRLRPGEEAIVFDGEGREVRARIVALSLSGGVLEAIEPIKQNATRRHWVLGQGLPKGDKLEQIIQHTTELGVSELYPLCLTRSVSRPPPSRAQARVKRWQRIASEACKQCRRSRVPRIREVSTLERFCQDFEGTGARHGVVLYEAAEQNQALGEYLARSNPASSSEFWILVGPEGGLELEEIDRATEAGLEVVRLGPHVLRTETAGLVALAVLQYAMGEWVKA